jgi:hypothetical protein
MAPFNCPQCGEFLSEGTFKDGRCQSCGATLSDERAGQPAAAESPRNEQIAELESLPKPLEARSPLGSAWPDVNIRRSDHGETLAVLALLLPLIAQGLILACHFNSWGLEVALSWGTIAVTAVLLTVDAAMLGTRDLRGVQRSHPVALFAGMLLFWIIGYPVVFFRRRYFGRPNLGPLAILVAVFFVAAPFLKQYLAFGTFNDGPPTCTSREVTAMVSDLIRKGSIGPSVRSISDYREISYDSASQIRKGQCVVKTQTESVTVNYSVRMLNPTAGTFEVNVEPFGFNDPPSCTDPEVVALVEGLVRDGFGGQQVQRVAAHEELRYDREKKTRYGRCQAFLQPKGAAEVNAPVAVNYRVYWLDQKAGQYQVAIDP